MAEKKSIIEEALLDIKKIQNALNANTKEILRSVAREEIDGLVKESLQEDDYEEETIGDDDAVEGGAENTEAPEGEEEVGGAEPEAGLDDLGDEAGSDIQSSEVGDGQEFGTDADALGGDELDMTGESDDDVIAIYKKLSGEDEIEVVGDEIHMTITEPGEYIVKAKDVTDTEAPLGAEVASDELAADDLGGEGDDDEMSYEIDMDDDESNETPESDVTPEVGSEAPEGEEEAGNDGESEEETEPIAEGAEAEEDAIVKEESDEEEEEIVQEAIPVGVGQAHRLPGKADIGQPLGAGAGYLKKESTTSTKQIVTEADVKYKKLLTEAKQLKSENEQFRQALKEFRNKLVETVVFNANLSYITKLFMEHSTTKEEKKQFIQRFDEVTSLKESKRLYKSIVDELASRKPINESVENKIIKEVTTGSSKQLNEATAYVDPSTQRIRDLINRVENKDKF